MKQILILEDNEFTKIKLVKLMSGLEEKVNVFAFSNIEEAFGCAITHDIDIYLVDIILCPKERNDFSGITFVEKIRECPSCATGEVVFLTSLAGLETELLHRVHCYDYVEKPIDEKRILGLLNQILSLGQKTSQLPERVYLRNDGIVYPIDVAEIRYVVYQNRSLLVHTGEECIEAPNLPLKSFLRRIKRSIFISPLRGTAVNIDYIESVDYVNHFVSIKGISQPISMGPVMQKKFRAEYEKYVRRGF